MPFTIVKQDITKMKVDAIVNAANTELLMGGGVCGAIFHAAGVKKLQAACDKVSPVETGKAAITPGFALQSRYIIHAVGPVYRPQEEKNCEMQLRSAYTEALRLADKNGCKSIAFPLISGGIYGYPKKEALQVASSAIAQFLLDCDMDVYLAVLDKTAFAVSEELLGSVKTYVDAHYAAEHGCFGRRLPAAKRAASDSPAECNALPVLAEEGIAPRGLDALMENMDKPFNETLLQLIDEKGKTDVEVYKRANMDRKLFSKIRTGNGYMPSKRTVLALAVALELSLAETDALLECAGYALSHSQKFDVIIEFFIVNRRFDIFEINEVLFAYDQPLLGAL